MSETNDGVQPSSLKDLFLGLPTGREEQSPVLLLDGGVSTHLQDRLQRDDNHESRTVSFPYRELWSSGLLLSAAGQRLVGEGHEDWLRSGADIISTVSYQCHYQQDLWPRIDQGASSEPLLTIKRMDRMLRDAVALARHAQDRVGTSTAAARPTFVAVSLGCFGAALANGAEYTGNYGASVRQDDLVRFHRRKLQQALVCRSDAIAFETIPSHLECLALVELLTDAALSWDENVTCWVSLACRNGTELNDGSSVEQALGALTSIPVSRLHGIGFNCCSVETLANLAPVAARHLASQPDQRAVLLYPNAGESWNAETESWSHGTGRTDSVDFADDLLHVVDLLETEWYRHANFHRPRPTIVVGGCCRTRPQAIAELRKRIDERMCTSTGEVV